MHTHLISQTNNRGSPVPLVVLPRIESIKQIRQKIPITQKKLADMTGVSTSMINQIESGRTRPSYDTARKIFDALAKLQDKAYSSCAGDFCSSSIVMLDPEDTLHEAVKMMHAHSISQIPIFENRTNVVGVITEDGLVKHLSDVGESGLQKAKISDKMDPPPPIVDYHTPANVLVPLIRYSKCILVSKESRIVGIITASDTLKVIE